MQQMLKRMSPVPKPGGQRGQSPVTQPLRVPREITQQMRELSIFPDGSGAEPPPPPPPYPISNSGVAAVTTGTAAHPPPSYSQSLAMRGSPTLSSTSSDHRYVRRGPTSCGRW